MLRISCDGCGTAAYAECGCKALAHDPAAAGTHHGDCPYADLGGTVTCPPGSGCCDGSAHPGVYHDQAANACPQIDQGTHGACPEPDACKSSRSTAEDPCSGGHCHLGIADCTVCRTVTIEVLPGTVTVSKGD
jgi:hypothetical protein